MPDHRLIDILSSSSLTFHIRHNAHRETQTTVARHLLHRERLGETISFASTASRVRCMETETLWELSFRNDDDTLAHVAGANLDECLQLASAVVSVTKLPAIAA